MKYKKKISIILSILLVGILLIIGVSFAVFTFNETSGNSKLIAGDIYMHYKETNELVLSDAMPTSIDKYMRYQLNPIMATQEMNELLTCVSYFSNNDYKEGDDAKSFCQGIGETFNGYTFQEIIDGDVFLENELKMFLKEKIIILENGSYKVNPVMKTQSLSSVNELTKCMYNIYSILGVSDSIGFCQGSETYEYETGKEYTFQESINNDVFSNGDLELLLLENIIILENDEYKVNPIMKTQKVKELIVCVEFVTRYGFSYGEGSATSYCQGKDNLNEIDLNDSFDTYKLDYLKKNNVISQYIITNYNIYKLNEDMTEEDVQLCVNYLTSEWGEEKVGYNIDEGESYEDFCRGTGTIYGDTFQQTFDYGNWWYNYQLDYFVENNIISSMNYELPYFEFTISGKNTYPKQDIWYEIILNHGDNHGTRTTRIKDELLNFSLVEIRDGIETVLFNNKNYLDLTSKRIWVSTIPKNTNKEVKITYRLYMFIDVDTTIGNMGQDYTLEEWEDVFASIKVNVAGDFNEKEIPLEYEEMYDVTDESCFTTIVNNNEITITDYNTSCGSDVVIPKTIDGYNVTIIESNAFYNDGLTSVVIPNTITTIKSTAFPRNNLTSIIFEKNSNLTTIGNFAFYYNQLTSVVIPNTVMTIENGAFENNNLTSVIFEENSNLEKIDSAAFTGENQAIISVTIPNSVTYLECAAFNDDVIIYKRDNLVCENKER